MISEKRRNKLYAFIFACGLLITNNGFAQSSFTSKEMKVGIFSSTPLEDIKAQATNGTSVIIPKTKQLAFQLPIKSFVFSRSLMQEHFNENYMESEKYPNATFKGTIQENIDFLKDGKYPVTVKGVLTMHGVSKDRAIAGVIDIVKGKPTINSSFEVACADHKIKIPSIVYKKIAEKITVSVSGSYN